MGWRWERVWSSARRLLGDAELEDVEGAVEEVQGLAGGAGEVDEDVGALGGGEGEDA